MPIHTAPLCFFEAIGTHNDNEANIRNKNGRSLHFNEEKRFTDHATVKICFT